jgi:hypothetical protein
VFTSPFLLVHELYLACIPLLKEEGIFACQALPCFRKYTVAKGMGATEQRLMVALAIMAV